MVFRNMFLKYQSPETGGEGGGGGGEAPVTPPTPDTPDTPTAEPEVVDEKKSETTPESKEDSLPQKTEDKSKLGQVTSLVEAAGLDMVEVAKLAKANEGKLDLDTMVALKEKHGDAIASLIADQIQGIHAENKAASDKRDAAVYDQVKELFADVTEQTGEETWKELAGWAKDNVSNEHRSEINGLLAQGGLAAKLAVQELATAFKESQGTQEFQEADLLEADTTTKSSEGGMISKSDYNRELNKLLESGHVYGESREIAKLDSRRAKSIGRM